MWRSTHQILTLLEDSHVCYTRCFSPSSNGPAMFWSLLLGSLCHRVQQLNHQNKLQKAGRQEIFKENMNYSLVTASRSFIELWSNRRLISRLKFVLKMLHTYFYAMLSNVNVTRCLSLHFLTNKARFLHLKHDEIPNIIGSNNWA